MMPIPLFAVDVPRREGRKRTSEEIAWLAGLLEGEGSFYYMESPSVALLMTDEDVVARAAGLIGCNYRREKRVTKSGKPIYRLRAFSQTAADVMREVYPLMSARRRKAIDDALGRFASQRQVNPRVTPNEKASIIEELQRGFRVMQVAKHHGRPYGTVWSIARQAGVR